MVITGRVNSWNSSSRIATVEGISGPVPVMRHVTSISAGDTGLVLVESGQAWLAGVLGNVPPPPPPPDPNPEVPDPALPDPSPPAPPAPPAAAPVVLTFRPSWSGTWRGGWRSDTSDLYQGDYTGRGINAGACWWGSLPSAIQSGTLTLVRHSGAGVQAATAPTMTLLAGASRPAGAATVLASNPGPAMVRGASTTWTIPTTWIAQLNSGAAGGIGITSGSSRTPYLALVASGLGMTLTLTVLE